MNRHTGVTIAVRQAVIAVVVTSSVLHAQTPSAPPLQGTESRQCVVAVVQSPVTPATYVRAGENLQAALDSAVSGDVLELEPGATFTGNYTLPVKAGTAPITVRTRLTLPETRVDPAAALATLRTPNSLPALKTIGNTAHWRLEGLRFAAGATTQDVVALGDGLIADAALLPRDLVLDRVVIEADTSAKNGLALNSADTTLRRSVIRGVKLRGVESHAIVSYNSPGPFVLDDNTIEAGSIGVLFGGAKPAIDGLIPSDIRITRNLVTRPLAMKGVLGFGVKNLLELKNAQRVVIRGNVFEHNWPDGQAGAAILFTVRAQSLTAPWSTIRDVDFSDNIVRKSGAGFNVLGLDNAVIGGVVCPSTRMENVIIRNNLLYELDHTQWGVPNMASAFLLIAGSPRNLHILNNTVVQTGNMITLDGPLGEGFRFVGNIIRRNRSGMAASSGGTFAGAEITGNVIGKWLGSDGFVTEVAPVPSQFPPGNFFPPKGAFDLLFADPASGNYRQTAYPGVRVESRRARGRRVRTVSTGLMTAASKAGRLRKARFDSTPLPLIGTGTAQRSGWRAP